MITTEVKQNVTRTLTQTTPVKAWGCLLHKGADVRRQRCLNVSMVRHAGGGAAATITVLAMDTVHEPMQFSSAVNVNRQKDHTVLFGP